MASYHAGTNIIEGAGQPDDHVHHGVQESHAGRDVKLVRSVSILRGCNSHSLPEFAGWNGDPRSSRAEAGGAHAAELLGVHSGTAQVRSRTSLGTKRGTTLNDA